MGDGKAIVVLITSLLVRLLCLLILPALLHRIDARPAGPSRGSFDFQALLVRITEELMHLRLDSGDSTQRESEHGQERECRVCRG